MCVVHLSLDFLLLLLLLLPLVHLDLVWATSSISSPKQERSNQRHKGGIVTVLAEAISWVVLSINVEETQDLSSNSFPDSMVG